MSPDPLVVSATVPDTGADISSGKVVLLFCQVWFAPSTTFITDVLDTVYHGMNDVVPVTLALTMMPWPAGISAPPVLIVSVEPAFPAAPEL